MSDELFDDETALMSRLGIDKDQLGKVATFLSIINRDLDEDTAAEMHNVSVDEVEDKRYSVVRMMHLADHLMDDQMIEVEGALPPILSKTESGVCSVGEYSNYKLGRAVFDSFEGDKSLKECGDEWGFTEEVVDYARGLYTKILLYLGAEAIKASPYLTTLGIFDRVSNAEDFVQLRTIVEDHLKEDDSDSDTESEFEDDFTIDPDED